MYGPKWDTFEKHIINHTNAADTNQGCPKANLTHKDMLDKNQIFFKLEFRILIFNENSPICEREGNPKGRRWTVVTANLFFSGLLL